MTTKTMTPPTTMVVCPCPRCYIGAHELPELAEKYRRVSELQTEVARLRQALELIACPERPDGTYNRDRRACELLAKDALKTAIK